jgi:hypothetical protein
MFAASITGKWESTINEVRPNPWGGKYFLRRFFDNKDNEARGTLVFYTDDTYTDKNMSIEVTGPYHFLQPSPDVPGATETDFEFSKIKVTPYAPAMVDMLNAMPSDYLEKWEAGVSQTAGKPGQHIMGMVIGVYREYDVTKVEGDLLYYGARPADGSAPDAADKRAKSLQPALKKVKAFSEKL